ncbi:MAG: O-methyltransferase [Formosimonas sp.]
MTANADAIELTLTDIIARLPAISPTTLTAATLEHYLNELYALGRLRLVPNISPANTAFLQGLIQTRRPQRLLEIGCANGYSTLRFWQIARAWEAHITTMDISRPPFEEASHHFAVTGAAADIAAHLGHALEVLPTLPREPFDFIFIDAHKAVTLDFFVRARKLAAPDALIVVDDVVKFKHKMQRFYDYLATHKIVYNIEQVDADDGVMLIDLAQQP